MIEVYDTNHERLTHWDTCIFHRRIRRPSISFTAIISTSISIITVLASLPPRQFRKKERLKRYTNIYQTPFEALASHCNAPNFLKEGIAMEKLQTVAKEKSDNECAALMQKAKAELFKKLTEKVNRLTIST